MLPEIFFVSFIVFLFYWIIGGALLATVSFIRNAKIRKARFGCLYTIAAALSAFGAVYSASILGEHEIGTCLAGSTDFFQGLASLLACGMLPIIVMVLSWFAGLGLIGLFLIYISRSHNQSWMDRKYEEDADLEITFEKR